MRYPAPRISSQPQPAHASNPHCRIRSCSRLHPESLLRASDACRIHSSETSVKRDAQNKWVYSCYFTVHIKTTLGGDSSNLSLRQAQAQFILNDQGHRGIFGETENPLIQGLGCNCLDLFFLQKLFRKLLPKTTVFRASEQRLVNEHNALSSGLCIQLEHASMCWFLSKHCLCLSAILIPIEKAVGQS